MTYKTEEMERMHRRLTKCPICKSEIGYEPSVFYPNVKCRQCQAEWFLYKDGLELREASREGWDKSLLNEKHSFEFWKKLKKEEITSLWEGVLPLNEEEYVLANWRVTLKKGGKKMFKGEAFMHACMN